MRYYLHGKYIALAVSKTGTTAHPARGRGARVGLVRASPRAQGASLARDAADVALPSPEINADSHDTSG